MVNFDYDCSGWATKANVRCYDGLVIAQDAFKECSGKVVPMVYNHDHSNVDNVIGHCLLENRPGGVYCYAKFNDTNTGKTARQCVESGDLNAFSIFANGLQKVGQDREARFHPGSEPRAGRMQPRRTHRRGDQAQRR